MSPQQIPDEVVLKKLALVNGLVSLLGMNINATSAKAIRLLGWLPRPREEAIIARTENLLHSGLVT